MTLRMRGDSHGDELRLLHAMGHETANVHLGTPAARAPVLRHVTRLPGDWLYTAARAMAKATKKDWKAWRGRKGDEPQTHREHRGGQEPALLGDLCGSVVECLDQISIALTGCVLRDAALRAAPQSL